MRAIPVRVAAPTSTGTLDLTSSGGGTCLGALFWWTLATANNTATNGASLGIGAGISSSAQWALCAGSQHGVVATNTTSRGMTDQAIAIQLAGGGVDGEANFDSIITDGVRLNFTNAPAGAYLLNALLFFSDDASEYIRAGSFDTTSGDATVSSLPSEPTAVIVASIRGALDDTAINGANLSVGFVLNNATSPPTQKSINWGEGDNIADGAPRNRIETALVCAHHSASTLLGQVEINTFTSSGFTAEQVNGSGYACTYVAIKSVSPIAIATFNSPTSTGANTHGWPGFPVQSVFGFVSLMEATGTTELTGPAGSWGVFAFSSTSNEFCSSIQTEDLSATTDTQSIVDTAAVNLPSHDGGTGDDVVGDVTAILDNGFEITYTAVHSAAKIFGGLAFQLRFAGTGAGTSPVPVGDATAALEFTGTGAGNSLAPVGSGVAALEFVATGAGNAPVATGAGVAALEFTATGVGVAPVPTGAGTGTHTPQNFTGTGDGFAPVPQGAADALLEFLASASGQAPAPVGAGLAELEFAATAQGTAPVPVGSGQALLAFVASAAGFAPVPVGDAAALLEFLAAVGGLAPVPVGAGVALHVGFEVPPMVCPSQLSGSYVFAAALLGSYLPNTELQGSRAHVSQLEGEVC